MIRARVPLVSGATKTNVSGLYIAAHFTSSEHDQMDNFLKNYSNLFPTGVKPLSRSNNFERSIETPGAKPFCIPPYRTTGPERVIVDAQVDEYLKLDVFKQAGAPTAVQLELLQR